LEKWRFVDAEPEVGAEVAGAELIDGTDLGSGLSKRIERGRGRETR
jgi:hypothetical protein